MFPFRKGAWVWLYGIPLHAWNENFFKLCVVDCGSFLGSDKCSLNRERFDFVRVLISTSSLEVVNVTDQIIVDGVMVDIKIIEEWGFSLGENAFCLRRTVRVNLIPRRWQRTMMILEIMLIC